MTEKDLSIIDRNMTCLLYTSSTEYPQNTFVYEVLRTPIGSSLESGPEIVKVGVRSTKVASKDITVHINIYIILVASFDIVTFVITRLKTK